MYQKLFNTNARFPMKIKGQGVVLIIVKASLHVRATLLDQY